MASVRVLLAGDFEVVSAAVDGRQAIERGESLPLDLTWLDVGMPRTHGIEAAQRIREIVPDGKILFLSVERSPEFEQVALGTGAQEAQARLRLLPAIESLFPAEGMAGRSGPRVL